MKQRISLLLLTLFSCFSFAGDFQADVTRLLNKHHEPNRAGIIIQSLETGKILFQKNAKQLFAPASTLKLLTAIAALDHLGENFRFQTQLRYRGNMKNHQLHGDLVLHFSGDPTLTHGDLQQLLDHLSKKSIKQINGTIWLDASAYDNQPYAPGWPWEDLSYAYAAPLYAYIIDENRFDLTLQPRKIGQRAALHHRLSSHIIHLHNQTRTTLPKNSCLLRIYSDKHNHYRALGCLNKYIGKQYRKLALRDPLPYIKQLILESLKQQHIKFHGHIRTTWHQRKSKLLATHYSQPLQKIVSDMLKVSDNLVANSLLKKLGQTYYHTQGSWQNGVKALRLTLKHLSGLHFKKWLIDDGAGGSRYNLISPRQLSLFLYMAYQNSKIRQTLMDALATPTKHGTLAHRLTHNKLNHFIHAKTGTFTGASNLAGYVVGPHDTYSFVIFFNNFVGKNKPYQQLQDQLCRRMLQQLYPSAEKNLK